MYALNWFFFRWKQISDASFQRSVDEMEVDIAGLVASFLVTQAVQHAITGEYPHAHLLIQVMDTSSSQRFIMLAWSLMLTFVAAVGLPKLEEYTIKKDDHWARKGHRFLKVIMVMMVAWGYLVWGTWQFERYFNGDPMYGHMLFASLCTFVVLGLLYGIVILQGRVTSETARETNNITVSGLSLVAAWSWEHCFTLAFDVIGHRYSVGYQGLVPKLLMATIIPCIIIPVYVKHVRRAVLEAEEGEEEEDEERKRRILERAGRSPQSEAHSPSEAAASP